jgi:large subunit ribosomal protein L23
MSKFNILDTIVSPSITEKATFLSEQNKVVFKVHKGANKDSIKKSIEKIFKSGYKKAIITLQKGQSIDLSTGI